MSWKRMNGLLLAVVILYLTKESSQKTTPLQTIEPYPSENAFESDNSIITYAKLIFKWALSAFMRNHPKGLTEPPGTATDAIKTLDKLHFLASHNGTTQKPNISVSTESYETSSFKNESHKVQNESSVVNKTLAKRETHGAASEDKHAARMRAFDEAMSILNRRVRSVHEPSVKSEKKHKRFHRSLPIRHAIKKSHGSNKSDKSGSSGRSHHIKHKPNHTHAKRFNRRPRSPAEVNIFEASDTDMTFKKTLEALKSKALKAIDPINFTAEQPQDESLVPLKYAKFTIQKVVHAARATIDIAMDTAKTIIDAAKSVALENLDFMSASKNRSRSVRSASNELNSPFLHRAEMYKAENAFSRSGLLGLSRRIRDSSKALEEEVNDIKMIETSPAVDETTYEKYSVDFGILEPKNASESKETLGWLVPYTNGSSNASETEKSTTIDTPTVSKTSTFGPTVSKIEPSTVRNVRSREDVRNETARHFLHTSTVNTESLDALTAVGSVNSEQSQTKSQEHSVVENVMSSTTILPHKHIHVSLEVLDSPTAENPRETHKLVSDNIVDQTKPRYANEIKATHFDTRETPSLSSSAANNTTISPVSSPTTSGYSAQTAKVTQEDKSHPTHSIVTFTAGAGHETPRGESPLSTEDEKHLSSSHTVSTLGALGSLGASKSYRTHSRSSQAALGGANPTFPAFGSSSLPTVIPFVTLSSENIVTVTDPDISGLKNISGSSKYPLVGSNMPVIYSERGHPTVSTLGTVGSQRIGTGTYKTDQTRSGSNEAASCGSNATISSTETTLEFLNSTLGSKISSTGSIELEKSVSSLHGSMGSTNLLNILNITEPLSQNAIESFKSIQSTKSVPGSKITTISSTEVSIQEGSSVGKLATDVPELQSATEKPTKITQSSIQGDKTTIGLSEIQTESIAPLVHWSTKTVGDGKYTFESSNLIAVPPEKKKNVKVTEQIMKRDIDPMKETKSTKSVDELQEILIKSTETSTVTPINKAVVQNEIPASNTDSTTGFINSTSGKKNNYTVTYLTSALESIEAILKSFDLEDNRTPRKLSTSQIAESTLERNGSTTHEKEQSTHEKEQSTHGVIGSSGNSSASPQTFPTTAPSSPSLPSSPSVQTPGLIKTQNSTNPQKDLKKTDSVHNGTTGAIPDALEDLPVVTSH